MAPDTRCRVYSGPAWEDRFDRASLSAEWQWHDPGGRSTWETVPDERLLRVWTPAVAGMAQASAMAPRLLRRMSGDFAAETILVGADERESHSAGLLLWASPADYVSFGKGSLVVYDLRLDVCRQAERQTIGRGWLPGPDLYLRLERLGDHVTALCSSDGRHWLGCGEAPFAAARDLWIGLTVACPLPRLPGCLARFKGFCLFSPEAAA